MRVRTALTGALIVLFAALLGCGATDRFSEEVIAGEGVAVHRLGEPEQHWRGIPDVGLGTELGGGPEQFSEISGLTMDVSGRIIVVDRLSHEIRVFSSSGEFQFTLGGRGSGPGEVQSPCCVTVDRSGLLWVRDRGNGRFNAYALEASGARYDRQVLSGPGMLPVSEPPIFLQGDTLIDVSVALDGRRGYYRVIRRELTFDGAVVRTTEVPRPPPERAPTLHGASGPSLFSGGLGTTSSFVLIPAYVPRHLVAHSPTGDWAEIITSGYLVRWYGRQGQLRQVVMAEVEPGPELTPSQRAFQAQSIERFGRIPEFDLPERMQPLRRMFFDSEGRLWVQRTTGTGPARADIIGENGEYVASVEWPREVELYQGYVRGRTAVGIATDSLGIMRAVRMRFEDGNEAEP